MGLVDMATVILLGMAAISALAQVPSLDLSPFLDASNTALSDDAPRAHVPEARADKDRAPGDNQTRGRGAFPVLGDRDIVRANQPAYIALSK
jgi:hypothetical protein